MHVALWVSVGAVGKNFVKSLLAKYLPNSRFEPPQPDDLRAVYIPAWFIDGEVTGTVRKSGTEMPVTVQSLNSYMPGFSFDPLSTLSFSQPGLERLAVPFTPELRSQHGLEISCPPFSISPVPLLEVVKSLTPSRCRLPDSVTFDSESVEFSMGLAYVDVGTRELGGLLRKSFDTKPGSWLDRFSHAADDTPSWDLTCGTDCGFSSIGIPNMRFDLGFLTSAVSQGLDQKIQSKSDMATLADYGVDMDHPCVRVYAKEEVDANRRFLTASGAYYTMRDSLKKLTLEKIRRGEVVIEVLGKHNFDPEALFETLKKRVISLEKQREDLKPHWLRDWQDSQGQGQPAPPREWHGGM